MRNLRSFAVSAAQDDVQQLSPRTHSVRTPDRRAREIAGHHQRVSLPWTGAEVIRGDGDGVGAGDGLRDEDDFDVVQAIDLAIAERRDARRRDDAKIEI